MSSSRRRSLRLSAAARCAPINGTDALNDDKVWNPPNYKATLLGHKKLLMKVQDPAKAYDPHAYVTGRQSRLAARDLSAAVEMTQRSDDMTQEAADIAQSRRGF